MPPSQLPRPVGPTRWGWNRGGGVLPRPWQGFCLQLPPGTRPKAGFPTTPTGDRTAMFGPVPGWLQLGLQFPTF